MINNDQLMRRLFRWRAAIEFEGVKFYLRIVGDQIIEDARQAALLASRKVRRLLRDENSDEFLLHIDPIRDLSDDELKTTLVIMASRDVMRDYQLNTPRPITEPLGNNPSLEEQEQHQEALEQAESDYIKSVQVYVEGWRVRFTEGLDKMGRKQLEGQYARYRVDRVCEDIFNKEFEDRLIQLSVYTDDTYKDRMFTLDEYRTLPTEVKEVLRDAYTSMSIDPEELKNSPNPQSSP